MKVAIHQPEHFPYVGYFQKMAACDLFIILDDVQFGGPTEFQNRNRFRARDGTPVWFTVPVARGSSFLPIAAVRTAPDHGWRRRILRTLEQRFHHDFSAIYRHEMLVDINLAGIDLVREKLAIATPMIRSSTLAGVGRKSVRLASLCACVGATSYLCGPGARDYIDRTAFGSIAVEMFWPDVTDYFSVLEDLFP